jgi:hypothetical protein
MFHHALHTRLKPLSSIAALLFFVTSAACQPVAPKQTEGEKFLSLKEKTVQTANSMSGYKAIDVYNEAGRLVKQFNALHKKVQQTKDTDSILGDIMTGIKDMADTYWRLATLEIEVTQNFNKEYGFLGSTQGSTADMAESANAEIANYQNNIATLEKALQSETNPVERRKKEITLGGYKSQINSIRARKVFWEKLSQYQQRLVKVAGTHRDNIGLLFHALKTNAGVYAEAAKTIEMRQIAVDSLGNLLGMEDIESLITDILNTQIAIDDIVAKVSEAEFNFEPKQARPGM